MRTFGNLKTVLVMSVLLAPTAFAATREDSAAAARPVTSGAGSATTDDTSIPSAAASSGGAAGSSATAASSTVEDPEARRLFEAGVGLIAEGPSKYEVSVHVLMQAAGRGLSDAEFKLGVMHRKGWGVPQSDAKAAEWYLKAADKGNANAQCNLGAMCAANKDDVRAVGWYLKAMRQGHEVAKANLGIMLAEQRGIPRDGFGPVAIKEVFECVKVAAHKDHLQAQYALATMYNKGNGTQANPQETFVWLEKAAYRGHVQAQSDLGAMHMLHDNQEEAFKWFEKAALKQHPSAQLFLGMLYAARKTPGDYIKALELLHAAKKQGVVQAISEIAKVERDIAGLVVIAHVTPK